VRRRIVQSLSRAWWTGLGAVGLPRERWDALPSTGRRAVKAGLWVALFVLLVALFGVWKTSAFAVAAVIFLLLAPAWDRLTIRGWRIGRWFAPAAVIAIVASYPYYVNSMPEVPLFGPFPQLSTLVVMTIFTMMALGLNFVVGYAGLLDLGYVAFYAMGAYMAGWFASSQFSKENVNLGAVGLYPGATGFHFSIWLVLPMAGVATAVVGVLIGLPTLRLRGDYLAIVTLGFGEIIPQIANNGDDFFGTGFNLTGGTQGLTPIDGPGFGSWINDHLGLPANFLNLPTDSFYRAFYWTSLILVLITVFCSWRLRDSKLGRAWIAIREDEIAAAAMGVPLMRTKTWSYATGAFFGGVAGAFFASFKSATFPSDFYFNISVFILCMVILGGIGNIPGVIFGACFLAYLNQEGLSNIGGWLNGHFGPGGTAVEIWHKPVDVPLYNFGIFGVILVVVMLLRPEGLIPSRRRAAEFREGVHDQPLYDVAGPDA
jgi:branched-chain amino acid transport system permease protein